MRQRIGIAQAIIHSPELLILDGLMSGLDPPGRRMMINIINNYYQEGKFDELNIYVEGSKNGQKVLAVGECKAQPGKKDADKFHQMIERVGTVLKGEIFLFLVGYSFDPEVENYIRENYPQTRIC